MQPKGQDQVKLNCKESRRSWWGAGRGVSEEMSVIWMDRQVDGTGDEQSSLHVGVSPVPQGLMSFLDDLGRCPAQDIVGASRFVIGSCGKENAHWFLAGGGHAGWQSEWGSTGVNDGSIYNAPH